MAEFTIEQQKAIALSNARRRQAEAELGSGVTDEQRRERIAGFEAEQAAIAQEPGAVRSVVSGTLSDLFRGVELAGRDVAEGAAGVAGIVTNPVSFIANRLSNLVGGPDVATEDLRGTASGLLSEAGLAAPETKGEQVVSNINQAVTGGGGFVGTGRAIAANAPGIARTVGQSLAAQPALQGAAAVTSSGAVETLPEDTSPAVKGAVGLLGAAVPFVPAGVSATRSSISARNAARNQSRIAAEQAAPPVSVGKPSLDTPVDITPQIDLTTQPSSDAVIASLKQGKPAQVAESILPDTKVIESAQRLGLDLNPEHYSTNVALQSVARALKSQGGSKLQANEARVLNEVSERADNLVADLGGSSDKAGVSESLRLELTDTIDDLAVKANEGYSFVSDAIPATAKVNTGSLRNFIDNKVAVLGGNPKLLRPPEKAILTLLGSKKKPNIPTYAALDRVRKEVGRGFQKKGTFADEDQAILSEVYGVLSDIQSGVAGAFGVRVAYAASRSLVAKRKAVEDAAVQLFGRNLSQSLVPKIQGAATSISKGDVSKFNQLLESVPEGSRAEVAATVLGDVFAGGARRGGELGQGFVSAFASLNRNQTAKNVLLRNLSPESRQRFNDIGRVFTSIIKSNAKPLANPSGSAAGIVKALEDGSALSKLYDVGKKVATAEGVSTSVGVPGVGTAGVIGAVIGKGKTPATQLADELLTSPAFKAAMNKVIRDDASGANNIIQNSPAFKKWKAGQTEETIATISRIGFMEWLSGNNDEP